MQVDVAPPTFTLDKTLLIKLIDSRSKVNTIVAAGDEVDIDDDGDVIVKAKQGDNSNTGAGQCSASLENSSSGGLTLKTQCYYKDKAV